MADNGFPEGWKREMLRDHLTLCRNGLVAPQNADPNVGVPITRIETISSGTIDWSRVGYVPPDKVDEEYILQPGDVLLSHINSVTHIGKVAQYRDSRALLHGMNLMVLRFAPTLDKQYAWHVLESARTKAFIERRAKKAVNQASVNREDVGDLEVLLPPPDEQRRIAEVLDAIDAAIEKTEAVIAATQRLRSALLADLLTRGVPGWHNEWKQVPGIGTIPACWEVVRLGEVCEHITKGATPTTYGHAWADAEDGVPFLRSECVSEGEFIPEGLAYISAQAHESMRRSIVRAGDILMTITGYVGRVCRLPAHYPEANINQHIARIRVKPGLLAPDFAYCALRHPRVERMLRTEITGIAYPQIGLAQVQAIEVPLPNAIEQRLIAAAQQSLADRRVSEQRELEVLNAAKRAAAAALLSGRVRVSTDGFR